MNGEFNYWTQDKGRSHEDFNVFCRNDNNPWEEASEQLVRAFIARPDQDIDAELKTLQENGVYETRTQIIRSEPAGVC